MPGRILSLEHCALCRGDGVVKTRRRRVGLRWQQGRLLPDEMLFPKRQCGCVWRRVFRACHAKYLQYSSTVSGVVFISARRARSHQAFYERPIENFLADFHLVGMKALAGHSLEAGIFRYHILLGEPWTECCPKLRITRGQFFHAVYRAEELLGRAYFELRPFPLYPVSEYFRPVADDVAPCAVKGAAA